MTKTDFLKKWLGESFFEMGAFTFNGSNQKILLGKGGYISEKENDKNPSYFYIKEFFRPKYYYYYPEDLLEVDKQEIELAIKPYLDLKIEYEEKQSYDDVFINDFNQLRPLLDGTLKKAVLVSVEKSKVKNPAELRKKVISKSILSNNGWPYGIWNKDYGISGATPEILFERQSNTFRTMALAGTKKIGQEKILRESEKDNREHQYVVDHIVDSIQHFCKDIHCEKTQIAPFAKMIHLQTNIVGELCDNINFFDLINTLSPTAALGGYPKEEATSFLEKSQYSQLFPRRFFGSAFGYNHNDFSRALVMIRNIQFSESDIMIESGAGIIKESVVEHELSEIKLKRETVKELFL